VTETLLEPDRLPVSSSQELWCGWPGSFGPRFVLAEALQVTGYVDVAALRWALDQLVARHEILRTIVVHDAAPPYQQVFPPAPVPLVLRDVPPGTDRGQYAQDLLRETELSSLDARELPLLRAALHRFDDEDAVLTLVTHHTAADGWSLELLNRDLAAFYNAHVGRREADLPEVRGYADFAAWQRSQLAGSAGAATDEYWRDRLDGAEIFALPTDRPIPEQHTSPYRAACYTVGPDEVAEVNALAAATRSSPFVVVLAVLNILAHRITGTTDPVVTTMSAGRGHRPYRDTVGPFLNFIAVRTDLDGCEDFRDVVARTRAACFGAQAHDVPMRRVEQIVPELMRPLEDRRNCDFTFGFSRPTVGREQMRIADGMAPIRQDEQHSVEIPGGAVWTMGVVDSGEAYGKVQYNPDEFDDSTVTGWVDAFRHLLARAVREPDLAWKTL
jgi:condensation enzyme